MIKQNSSLNSSHEIKSPKQISSNSEKVGFFTFFGMMVVRVTPRDEIVYTNLEIREMTWVKFMRYNLNFN